MPNSRSFLFVPGDRPDRFQKAYDTDADAVIIDLEDGVRETHKHQARQNTCQWMESGQPVFIRTNSLHTPWFADDIAVIKHLTNLRGLVIPKAEEPSTIASVIHHLPNDLPVILILETALGIWNARRLAEVPQVARLSFGSIDLQADTGIQDDRDALLYARSRIVLASRIGYLPTPIDGVTPNFEDDQVLQDDVTYAKSLGFGGKFCIHPKQVAIVNEGFLPSEKEIEQAEALLSAVRSQGTGALSFQGQMIDKPAIIRAQQVVATKRKSHRRH